MRILRNEMCLWIRVRVTLETAEGVKFSVSMGKILL